VVRYPRGAARQVGPEQVGSGFTARRAVDGGDDARVCVIAVGRMLEAAEHAATLLREERGIAITVWDPRVVVPLDEALLDDAARHEIVVTIEDGMRIGGIGSLAASLITERRMRASLPSGPIITLGTPVEFLAQGRPKEILAELGLDAAGIFTTVVDALASADAASPAGATSSSGDSATANAVDTTHAAHAPAPAVASAPAVAPHSGS
jgi:1-deoxy-D-xylulose-5-phosphate synthase